MTEFVDLILDNGERVRIECPDEHVDELHELIENALKQNSWLCPDSISGCAAFYLGNLLERVAMRRVVGVG